MRSLTYRLTLFGLLLLVGGCNRTVPAGEATTAGQTAVELSAEQQKRIGLTTVSAETRLIQETVRAYGQVDVPPQNLLTLHVAMGGYVKSTALLQGARVRKGDVLVELVHPDYVQLQQDYREAVAKLEFVRADYERQQELAKGNANAAKALQLAAAEWAAMRAQTDGLRARLQMLALDAGAIERGDIAPSVKVYASMNGFIGEVNINVGKYVSPSEPFATLINLEHVHVELEVLEQEVSRLKEGQPIRYRLGRDTASYQATVYLIGKEISAARTVRVHGHPVPPSPVLLPGMFVSADVVVGAAPHQVVSEEAIVSFEGKKFVFVQAADQTRFEITEVHSEPAQKGWATVAWTGAAPASARIVKTGAYTLLSMLKNAEEE
ncbi:MAG: efflux RND transporter periplasmic adaptor subunit [Cyclobacteriaceae bacterium]|jgi:cobalt-zinc-cadmium efflux system membrane fusion protein|nr:efflux RND transporter periplasmic adaptor subunit [Cyclobacteriaceae bacterium]